MISIVVIFLLNTIVNQFSLNSKNKIIILFLSSSLLNFLYLSNSVESLFLNNLIFFFYIFIIINFYTIWNSSIRIEIIRKLKNKIKYNNHDLLQNRIKRFKKNNNTIMNKNFFVVILRLKKIFFWILNEKK